MKRKEFGKFKNSIHILKFRFFYVIVCLKNTAYTTIQSSRSKIFLKSNEIAIPEIQRPFVWKGKQVRDLVDYLYKGYPTGYLIISKSPDLKLKDGSLSVGKKIMIDGQQSVTAMMTALSGLEVFNADFEKKHIAIAYNPFAKNDEECFAVQDNAILKVIPYR